VLVHRFEFGEGGNIEAGALIEERLDDLRRGVGLDRIIALHPRQMLLKAPVVAPDDLVVDH
jgi:hypothetical protein